MPRRWPSSVRLTENPQMEIISIPVVSTGHLSISTRGDLGRMQQACPWTVIAPYDEGWFVYASADWADDTPPDLLAAFAWARGNGHEWLRFDSAGPYVSGLIRYE